jgi:ABC-2 type transport system permease protein
MSEAGRTAGVWHLLSPKIISATTRGISAGKSHRVRIALLAFVGVIFWVFVFGLLYRLLNYFAGIAEIGSFLAAKLLGLLLLSLFGILILSNIVTALSSFFLAKDLDLLVAAPVDWLRLYVSRLIDTALHSSWMVVLVAIPILTAYGLSYHGGLLFPLVAVAVVLPLLLIPAALGSALTLVLVNIFPAKRTKDILSVIAVLAAAGILLALRLIRPERLTRPEGFHSLIEFISLLRTPTSPWLPSEWAAQGLMSWLNVSPDALPFYMLWSTAAAAVVIGAALHARLYPRGFTKSQESGGSQKTGRRAANFFHRLLSPWGVTRYQLLLKEVKTFFRDTTQWSQLILLAVLVVVYVFNVKFLPLHGPGMTFFLTNVIPFINIVLAGFVIASIAARFVFPGVSLEGRTLWLLRSSPLDMKSLLWAKFWVGTLPLLVLALVLIFVTGVLMEVDAFMMTVSVMTITLLTFGIAGLALGFGALFPRFETENAAQIPTSFGGLLLMMSAVVLIGSVVILEARPLYRRLGAEMYGGEVWPYEIWIGFALAGILCVAATFVPIRIAIREMRRLEGA